MRFIFFFHDTQISTILQNKIRFMLNVTLVHLQKIPEVLLLFDFTLQREKKYINGNFIILNVTIEDKRLTSVNLYMSNKD